MAVVGHAEIIVKAITKGVKEDIRRGFDGIEKDAQAAGDNIGKSFNDGLSKGLGGGGSKGAIGRFSRESEQLAREFHKGIRSSYKFQAGIGALLQSVMALGGGLLALAGNMAGAAASGAAFIGIMAQMKIATLVGKQAFHGIGAAVKQATTINANAGKTLRQLREEMQQLAFSAEQAALSEEGASIKLEKAREALARVQNLPPDNRARREAELAYKEADLAYRKAKDHAADLQEQIANPQRKKNGNRALQDPYKGLTESQKKFAQYLVSVQPKMKELREAAASGFLPEITKQMKILFKGGYFDMLVKGFGTVSQGLAKAVRGFAGTLFDPSNKKNLAELFKNSGTTVGTLGASLGKAFGGLLTLLKAIQPLVSRFTLFLDSKADAFGKNMRANFANISGFFNNAGDAAAGWGTILGRIFEKFKNLIKANIGPGTGGQLLLDYFKQGATGFRGMDGAAGEFARKNHFLAAATNLKAMLDSLGKIFGFMSDIGTDPAIASFWSILSELRGPLEEIFNSITGSSDELARMLVAIVEIISSFADSGQLRTYMTVVADVLKAIGAVVNTLKPLMQFFGPLIGAIGGVVTAMLLLKKVTMLMWGTMMILKGGLTAIKVAMAAHKIVTLASAAANKGWMLTEAGATKATMLRGKELLVNNIRMAMSTAAKSADAAGNVLMGTTMAAATPAATAFGIAVNSAIWPLTLIAIAIAAVIAAIVLLVSWMNQIKADNVKKASKEINKNFEETRNKTIAAADAQKMWTDTLLSVGDSQKEGIKNIRDVGKALDDVGVMTRAGVVHSAAYKNASEALDTYMKNLAALAKKNLPEAQRQFRNMIVSSGMSRQATEKAVLANKDMIASLEKQANAMGDTIKKADGTVDAIKAVDYAIGEGSYLRQRAVLEQKKFADTYANATKSFINSQDAMQKATEKGKFSLKTYLAEMGKQSKALLNWTSNISKLQTLMTDKKALQSIIAQGAAGADLVQSLVDQGAEAIKQYSDVTSATNDAMKAAENYARAYGSTDAVANLVRRQGGSADAIDRISTQLQKMLDSGAGAFEIASKFNISEASLLAEQARLDSGIDLAKNVDITASWDADSLADAKKELDKALGVQEWKITTTKKGGNRDGGLIKRAMGGVVGRFADGYSGRVSGPGTARSDQIPAMISNGEFVMNARATAANIDLLNAMNNNKDVAGAAGNQFAVTINAAPGMDPNQIAKAVASELTNQLSRGASI